jgi:hypothetical protein
MACWMVIAAPGDVPGLAWATGAPFTSEAKYELPAITASVRLRKSLRVDIGNILTSIKIGNKYLASLKLPAIIRLLLGFYKNFFLLSSLLTLACAILYGEYGSSILTVLIWFKLLTQGLIWHYVRRYKKKEFYYYRNLGIRDTILWSFTLGFDLCIFALLLVLTHQWHP